MTAPPAPGTDDWIAVEETDDAVRAERVADVLREAGIAVRTRRDPGPSRGAPPIAVEVGLDRLDDALDRLDLLDRDEGDEPSPPAATPSEGGGPLRP